MLQRDLAILFGRSSCTIGLIMRGASWLLEVRKSARRSEQVSRLAVSVTISTTNKLLLPCSPPQHHFGRAHRSLSDADDVDALESLSDVTALLVGILRRLYGCWGFWQAACWPKSVFFIRSFKSWTELHVGRLLVMCTVYLETRLSNMWTCWWTRAHPCTRI